MTMGHDPQLQGGLRSGPGHNVRFAEAYALLETERVAEGVAVMARERARWLKSPEDMVRASRHYEAAAQILVRHAVMTAREFIAPLAQSPVPMHVWVIAEAAARIDLAGGWSDTPPITYEHGGVVTNAAILIDGARPIGAKCRRIPAPQLVLVLEGTLAQRLVLTELDQLRTYTQPQSPGALLKAAFCCADVVSLSDERSLAEQLQSKYAGGFEVHSWSYLPHGSGLGTSSILAGVVMSAISRAAGTAYDRASLNHAVLHLEQMLTTGGGWQDQVRRQSWRDGRWL
jgi:fucokinase